MKTLAVLLLLAVPMNAEVRAAVRGGLFSGGNNDAVGTLELDLRHGNWALAPAFDGIRGGYGAHAYHLDVRRLFNTPRHTFWVGAGPTWAGTNESSETTFNVDLGFQPRTKGRWAPFVAARWYRFDLPVFRDEVEDGGAVLSVGISGRIR